jgi:hypothetical protein
MIDCDAKRCIADAGDGRHLVAPRCAATAGLCADAEHGAWYDDLDWSHCGCTGTTGPWGAWRSISGHVTEGYLLMDDLLAAYYETEWAERLAEKATRWLPPVGWS